MAAVEDDLNSPVYDTWQDTWPLDDLLHDIYSQDFDCEYDALAYGVQQLQHSKTVKAFILDALNNGWEMGLSDLGANAFHIDVPLKKIIINNNGLSASAIMRNTHFRETMLMTMVRALRDAWHEKRHGGFDEKFNAESILMLERVRAADCDVMVALAAWELRALGHGDLWRQLLASDEGDLAIAFGCILEKETGQYATHKALHAAFEQWYNVSDRIVLCDHATLEYIDEVLRNNLSLGIRRAESADIEVLGCLPDRTTYLQGEGANILRAPAFAGLQDEVNQTHYMQIMHDMKSTTVQGVAFNDRGLAAKIFPNGEMTPETEAVSGN
jgi:hypothetical protein